MLHIMNISVIHRFSVVPQKSVVKVIFIYPLYPSYCCVVSTKYVYMLADCMIISLNNYSNNEPANM